MRSFQQLYKQGSKLHVVLPLTVEKIPILRVMDKLSVYSFTFEKNEKAVYTIY